MLYKTPVLYIAELIKTGKTSKNNAKSGFVHYFKSILNSKIYNILHLLNHNKGAEPPLNFIIQALQPNFGNSLSKICVIKLGC